MLKHKFLIMGISFPVDMSMFLVLLSLLLLKVAVALDKFCFPYFQIIANIHLPENIGITYLLYQSGLALNQIAHVLNLYDIFARHYTSIFLVAS